MGERKVLNKYFPPDFDHTLIPRGKRKKNAQMETRMMLPMSIQCNTCGEYMYRGKKFNSRKEDVLEEDYHGIRIYRFYIKCTACSAEITFKTDPKSGDYVTEKGCQRNFEPWREKQDEVDQKLEQKQLEEAGDSMKTLENRTMDSKREMDILDALDEIRAINQRHERVDTQDILRSHYQGEEEEKKISESQQLKHDREQTKVAFAAAKERSLKRPPPYMVHNKHQNVKKQKSTTVAAAAPVFRIVATTATAKEKPIISMKSLVSGYSSSSSDDG